MVQSLPALIKLRCFYLDGVSPGAMASTHVAVALSHSRADGQVSVLAVHGVGSRSEQFKKCFKNGKKSLFI